MSDKGKLGEGVLINNDKKSAFDIFTRITKAEIPVPEAIAKTTDKNSWKSSNRKLITQIILSNY